MEKEKSIKPVRANSFLQGYFGSQIIGKFGTVKGSTIYPYYENVYTEVPKQQITLNKVEDESKSTT